jgi:hypothetical protein
MGLAKNTTVVIIIRFRFFQLCMGDMGVGEEISSTEWKLPLFTETRERTGGAGWTLAEGR